MQVCATQMRCVQHRCGFSAILEIRLPGTHHTSETLLYKTQRGQELIFGDNIMNEIKVATKTPVYIRCARLFEI